MTVRVASLAAVASALMLPGTFAIAQQAKPAATTRADLRPMFVTPPEVAEGRRLAEKSRCWPESGSVASSVTVVVCPAGAEMVSLDGDALEYNGRARELLIGFLFALAILMPIYFVNFLIGVEVERYEQRFAINAGEGDVQRVG